jgi:predicted MFS family arabinose efflux permease
LAILFAASSRRWNEAAAKTSNASLATSSPSSPGRAGWRHQPRAVAGLAVVAIECGLESLVGLWAFVFLLESVALAPATAGVVVSGYWAALVVGRILLGSVAERRGTWPVLAAATVMVVVAAALVMSQQPIATAAGVVVLGLAVAPVYPLLVLTTAERTTAGAVDRMVGNQAAASTVGSVVFASLGGLIMGVDLTGFAWCVLALALLTGGGIWALKPGSRRR